MSNRWLVPLAVIVGLLLIVVAIVYFADTADALPSFFPGHEAGSTDRHVKHGLLALFLGLGCFVFVWFRTGPNAGTSSA